MSDESIPQDLRYTAEHEWVQVRPDGTVRVGITDFAQEALGDVVYVSLPEVGASLAAGDSCGEVESTKSVSDLYSPLAGEVTSVNEDLDTSPDLVNADPYGQGWMYEMTADEDAVTGLMDAAAYADLVG